VKNWLITGCSTGFGRVLAEKALARGDRVAATARRPETLAALAQQYPDTALRLELDVTRPDTIASAIAAARESFGRIDVVVNNAGFGVQGAVEEVSDAQIRELFAVNVFGVIDVIRAALPTLREQGGGHIVNVTSVGGGTGVRVSGLYAAGRCGVEGFWGGLWGAGDRSGTRGRPGAPGAFATICAPRVEPPASRLPAYDATHDAINSVLEGMAYADPAGCVELILQVVDAAEPPRQIVAGGFAWSAVEQVMTAQMEELNAWRAVSEAADAG